VSTADRLKELGITLPEVTPPLAVYRPAVRTGNLIFVSGQLPLVDGQVLHPGKLGAEVSIEQGYEAARQAGINALAAAKSVHGSLDGLRVIRTVGYVASVPDFVTQPAVVNGASELFRDVLGEELGIGARLAFSVTSLPVNAPVEVEILLEVLS